MGYIPVSEPLLDGAEKRYLIECVDSGWISSDGPFVARFEEAFARACGRRFGVAVCNGTAALEAAVEALGIGPGDEVIMPSFAIISCALAVVRAGGVPVVAESCPRTWNMDPEGLESLVTPRTKAIMAVHTYGLPAPMDAIERVARERGLAVIEDAAEAHALTWNGRPCGSFGELSCFSFYPNKLVTTGEGGMVLTDSPELALRLRSLRNLCFRPDRRFVHDELGHNFRMTNLQAALGLAQLERMEEFLARKRRVAARYLELLEGMRSIRLPLARIPEAESVFWVFGLVLEPGHPLDAQEAMRLLNERGIGTRPFFWPLHRQPVFERMGLFRGVDLPVARWLGEKGFYIPCYPGMSDRQVDEVALACRQVLDREARNG